MKRNGKLAAALLAVTMSITACGQSKPAEPAATTSAAPETSAASETTTTSEAKKTEASENTGETEKNTEESAYTVIVLDEKGKPVKDAKVQFCSDDQCLFEMTDADGKAVFTEPEGAYTVHILKAPEGFEKDPTEYPAPEKYGTVTITLKASSDVTVEETESTVWEFPELGVNYTPGAEVEGLKGSYDVQGVIGDDVSDPNIGLIELYYYAVPEEELYEYREYCAKAIYAYPGEAPETSHEDWQEKWDSLSAIVLTLVVVDGENEFDPKVLDPELELSNFDLVAENGKTRVYYFNSASREMDSVYSQSMGDRFEEYTALRDNADKIIENMAFTEADFSLQVPPTIIEEYTFDGLDLDGNEVTPADLFADSKVTLINIWATWCGPCKRELPELGELAKELEEKGCRVIGICIDAVDDETIGVAKELLAEAGCEYTNIRGWKSFPEDMPVDSFPSTIFVDSEGKVIGRTVIGAYVDKYVEVIDECLAEME